MHSDLTVMAIDWHYDRAAPELRAIVPRIDAILTQGCDTWDAFHERLQAFATEHRSAIVDALVHDETVGHVLVRVRDGALAQAMFDELPGEATSDDGQLIHHLLHGSYAAVPREPGGKHAASLYFSATNAELLQREAYRLNVSFSWIVQAAFKHAAPRISGSDRSVLVKVGPAAGAKKYALYFPGEMLDAMEAEARRLDCSVSSIAQTALVLARDELAKREAQ
ncbi:MAG: hypothetical protein AB7P03_13915 [Kofleriaceae bacterium]